MDLTDKQRLFADEYLKELNITKAYKAVYKNIKTDEAAGAAGTRLLKNVKVAEYVQKRMKDREKRTEITQDKVLCELARIAFSNGADFAKVVEKKVKEPVMDMLTGKVIGQQEVVYKVVEVETTDNIPHDKKAAITSIKQTRNGIEVVTADKLKALELIGKHLGMFTEKEESGKGEKDVAAALRGLVDAVYTKAN